MKIKLLILLISASLMIPAQGALAEGTLRADQTRGGGMFSFLKPSPQAAVRRAERKSERQLKRIAKRGGGSASADRAAVKERVAYAIAHPPKGRLWCVPFARTVAEVDLRGNAKTWWSKAKGKYARGHDPQVGAIISFAASRAMPQGHVGVVSQVISAREIWVDHANWDRSRVTLDDRVVDVSPKNDWSQVRVVNSAGSLGRINPVNGFIYN